MQLFRCFPLDVLHELGESHSIIDILNLLERNRHLPSAERWPDIWDVRNQIAHEYALNSDELAATLELACWMVGEMSDRPTPLQNLKPLCP